MVPPPNKQTAGKKLHNQGWWCNNTMEQWYFPQRVKYRSERKWHQCQGEKKKHRKKKRRVSPSQVGYLIFKYKTTGSLPVGEGRGFCDCGRPRVNVRTAPHQREPAPLLLADFIGLACRTDGANSYARIHCHVKERRIWFRCEIERYYGYNVSLTLYASKGL